MSLVSNVFDLNDCIAAIATAPGPGLRGIIRLSGALAKEFASKLFYPEDRQRWESAKLPGRHLGEIRWDALTVPLKADLWLWPTRRSYTGEPVAEIHTIGSPPLLDALLQELFRRGVRPARAGEFTLRAFLAGRIDLTQAEAVLGVIDATDQQQLSQALGQLAGGISRKISQVREQLLLHLADLEAGLDFADEDLDFVSRTEFLSRLNEARNLVRELLDQATSRMHTDGRFRVVLAGLPNAGKSTLFNALVGAEAALVSPLAGTTRDYVSAQLTWEGLPIELIDTAGVEDLWLNLSQVELHAEVSSQRAEQLTQADLILWCTAANLSDDEQLTDETLFSKQLAVAGAAKTQRVSTKADLVGRDFEQPVASQSNLQTCSTNESASGLPELIAAVANQLRASRTDRGELIASTAARCRESLSRTAESLARAEALATQAAGDELIACELRSALEELGQIAGEVHTDDLLDRIFSRFCIGK